MSNNKDFKVKNGIQPTVYQEGVGTVVSAVEGYSISGASYDSKSFSTATQNGSASGMFFKPDGTKVYVVGPATNAVLYQYGLSTAWDASTGAYDSVSFTLTDNAGNVFFKPDGTSMYVMNSTDDALDQYNLSAAWDITSSSYSQSFSYATQDDNAKGIFFKPDGTKMYIAGWTNDKVYEYNLSTAWDISTASYVQDLSIRPDITNSNPTGVFFTPDGLSMFANTLAPASYISKYSLSVAWDISTATYNSFLDVINVATNPYQIAFKPDGTKMFVVSPTTDGVFQYSTALNTASLDLSSGSVFDYTPTSNVQVTLTNPAASGTSSGATLLLGAEDATGVGSTFSTTLYDGTTTSESHRIQNGIDLAGDGGLVWIKKRDSNIANTDHYLSDTERGNFYLASNKVNAQAAGDIASYNSDGWTFNASTGLGTDYLGSSYVSWTFKKQTKFFDVVTWTGNSVSGREIPHNLGSAPGMIIVKSLTEARQWMVYHRSTGNANALILNSTATSASTALWNSTDPTSTVFTLNNDGDVNTTGNTYVAYLFAHDTDASSLIKCGSYTGTYPTNLTVNLGWEPQFVLLKNATDTSADPIKCAWNIMDTVRGLDATGVAQYLSANDSDAESSTGTIRLTSTGFVVESPNTNDLGDTYIYTAIRSAFVPTITYDPNLQWPSGTAPTSPAIGETDVITFNTTDGGTTYKSVQAVDGAK